MCVCVYKRFVLAVYMTVHGIQQQLQSSVLMHEHLPAWGLMIEPAALETEFVDAGMMMSVGSVVGRGDGEADGSKFQVPSR